MEISALTLRVLLLFFPGVLCAMLVDTLTRRRERAPAEFLTRSFVLGIGVYLVLYALRAVCELAADVLGLDPPLELTFFAALVDERQRIAWGEIALSALVSVPLAAVVAAAFNHNLVENAAEKLGLGRGFGENDVWAFLFNSPDVRWIIVRDLAHDLMFKGWVDAFSDSAGRPELLLRNVSVYRNSSGDKLYETSRLYLARPTEALVVELGVIGTRPTSGGEDGQVRGSATAERNVQEGRSESGGR